MTSCPTSLNLFVWTGLALSLLLSGCSRNEDRQNEARRWTAEESFLVASELATKMLPILNWTSPGTPATIRPLAVWPSGGLRCLPER